MIDHRNRKKKLIISYKNLTDDIRELFKEAYPDGYKDYLQKTIKPNGEAIFVVPLETPDTSYMVKFDVKIDTGLVEEDLDKDLYGEEEHEENEFAPLSEAIDKEEGTDNHTVGKMRHGALEEVFEGLPEDKKEFEMADDDLDEDYDDKPEDDESDSYVDGDKDEDDDMEPDDDELLDIEALLDEADSGEGMLREDNPPEEKRGRKKKFQSPELKAVQAVGQEVKEAKKNSKTTKTVKTATKTTSKSATKADTKTTTKTAKAEKTSSAKEPKAVKVYKTTKTAKTTKKK
jgi:hypothetical protein